MDYIAHHGIPGQKWGQRNGPPYPLKPGAHSAAEKKYGGLLGKRTSRGLTDIDSLELKRKSGSSTMEEDCAATNPTYAKNPKSSAYNMNCTNCVMTYALRRAGYDVEALPLADGRSLNEMNKIFDGCINKDRRELISFSERDTLPGFRSKVVEACKKLAKSSDSAVGFISVEDGFSGHVFSWEKRGNNITFLDPQVNKMDSATINMYFRYTRHYHAGVYRLDDCQVDSRALSKVCKDR